MDGFGCSGLLYPCRTWNCGIGYEAAKNQGEVWEKEPSSCMETATASSRKDRLIRLARRRLAYLKDSIHLFDAP